ncbi:MAG: hypothetical protein M1820_002993 [Bogoriella megaspora]|nr:MAG: hypothetical protein M1820_002993 [Bogoriella megaspora]
MRVPYSWLILLSTIFSLSVLVYLVSDTAQMFRPTNFRPSTVYHNVINRHRFREDSTSEMTDREYFPHHIPAAIPDESTPSTSTFETEPLYPVKGTATTWTSGTPSPNIGSSTTSTSSAPGTAHSTFTTSTTQRSVFTSTHDSLPSATENALESMSSEELTATTSKGTGNHRAAPTAKVPSESPAGKLDVPRKEQQHRKKGQGQGFKLPIISTLTSTPKVESAASSISPEEGISMSSTRETNSAPTSLKKRS